MTTQMYVNVHNTSTDKGKTQTAIYRIPTTPLSPLISTDHASTIQQHSDTEGLSSSPHMSNEHQHTYYSTTIHAGKTTTS